MTIQIRAPLRIDSAWVFPRPYNNSQTQNYSQAEAFLAAIGATNEHVNFRAIHDRRKDIPAIKRRGRLEEHWRELCQLNAQGYGIFVTIAAMDDDGDKLANVAGIRAHYVDLDSLSAMQDLERAKQHIIPPSFGVLTSPNKAHVYWRLKQRYRDNDGFTLRQAKLAQLFNGDKKITDPTRVMRIPGFHHHKGAPFLVQCFAFHTYSFETDADALSVSLAHVNVVNTHAGSRRPLGDHDLAAPSIEWVNYAFSLADPNAMPRDEWISFTAAIKQAMWSLVEPQEAYDLWSAWCARYAANDPGENWKQWNDLEETQVGWRSIERMFPQIMAYRKLGAPQAPATIPPMIPMPTDPNKPAIATGDILTAEEQAEWFKDDVLISSENKILCNDNVSREVGSYNSFRGGKLFILDEMGKTTDEAWKAVTRGRKYGVQKVQFTCFRPDLERRAIVTDELNREYVNTYLPAIIRTHAGDASLFERHMKIMLPNDRDRNLLLDYMAHNIKFPGTKIAWAPVLQSAEGVGKGAIKRVMRHAIGGMYFYEPKAKELAESGAKFNGWMENKLFFLVDEVKTDDRREMVEILKPFITETMLEVQGKGRDQRMGDTPGNWLFFTNHKDAIPITTNGRRFAIFYSALQTAEAILAAGLNDAYFNRLYSWLDREGGCEIVAHWLMQRPIALGDLPSRAPVTSSTDEALEESKGWLDQFIAELVDEGGYGFRAGWISTKALTGALSRDGRKVAPKTVTKALEALGYHKIGRVQAAGVPEADNRSYVWHRARGTSLQNYVPEQSFHR